jgi:hypothetical protein
LGLQDLSLIMAWWMNMFTAKKVARKGELPTQNDFTATHYWKSLPLLLESL